MSDNRNDLPPVNAPNFLERVREALSTYLGARGDKLDRGLTVRDLAETGVVELKPGYTAGRVSRGSTPIKGVGSAVISVGGGYTPDLTPPPMPTGFQVGAAITNIFVEHTAPTYTQGHGHAKTVVYGATWVSGDKPVFANAVKIAEFTGSTYSHPTNPSTTWHLWIKWVSKDGVESTVPAGGTNGLVTTTGQDVGLLLDALSGELTVSELNTSLNSRINLIDGGSSSTTLPYPLVNLAATQTALNQSIAQQLNDMSSDLLDNIVTISNTQTRIADAGIYLDAGTGTVKISGLEATNASLSTVETRMSAAESSIVTKATYTYVDNAIATAVIDPLQVPVFGALEARVATAETDIDALDASVALKATNLDLSATNVRMTSAESNISALTGSISNKVDNATFTAVTGGLDTRLGTAETNITVLGDTSSIRQIVEQTHRRDLDSNRDAEATLNTLLAGVTETNTRVSEVALARTDLTATIEAGLSAEATARTTLAAQVDANQASLVANYYTKASTDGAIASSAATLQAYANAGDVVVDAHVSTVETTKIGYCAIGGNASDHTTKSTCEAAGGVWNVGIPMATAVKQVTVSDGASSATLEQRFTAQKTLDDTFKLQYSVKLDNNGYVSGFGLYNAGATSEFNIIADKFSIAPVQTDNTAADDSPFFYRTVPTTINGVSVPAGAYMKAAFIHDATITNAKIADLAVDNAKIANMSVSKLTAGSLAVGQYVRSTSYTPGSAGFSINADGTAEFNSVTVRGAVYASSGSFTGAIYANAGYLQGLTIYNGSGQVLLSSGNTAADIQNNQLSLSSPIAGRVALNGGGGGSVDGIVMPSNPITSSNISTYIADLSVGTLKIAGEAVTIPRSAALNYRTGNGGWQDVGSLSYWNDSAGASALITLAGICSYSAGIRTTQFIIEWWINGFSYHYANVFDSGYIAGSYVPTPVGSGYASGMGVGWHSFRVMWYGIDSTVAFASGNLTVIGVKR